MITLKWLPVKAMQAPKHQMTILKGIVDVKTRNPFDIHVGRMAVQYGHLHVNILFFVVTKDNK